MTTNQSRKCTAHNKNGSPCKAWAIRGSHPPRCSSHAGLTGGQAGNQNRRTHGFYARQLTPQETADLVTRAQNITIDDEIAIMRVLLRRLVEFLKDHKKMKTTTYLEIVDRAIKCSRTVAYLLRHSNAGGTELWDKILDSVGDELGLDL